MRAKRRQGRHHWDGICERDHPDRPKGKRVMICSVPEGKPVLCRDHQVSEGVRDEYLSAPAGNWVSERQAMSKDDVVAAVKSGDWKGLYARTLLT